MSLGKDYINDHMYEIEKSKDEDLRKRIFTRGYREVRKKVASNPKYVMSCFNCAHYYQGVGDKTEACQKLDVLEYDMVIEGSRIYCLKWEQNVPKKADNMFNRLGRSKLD